MYFQEHSLNFRKINILKTFFNHLFPHKIRLKMRVTSEIALIKLFSNGRRSHRAHARA